MFFTKKDKKTSCWKKPIGGFVKLSNLNRSYSHIDTFNEVTVH